MTVCAGQMRCIGAGLVHYATTNDQHLPPFAFSDYFGNLPLSGHWGGAGPAGQFGRRGVENVNLWLLVAEGTVTAEELICPAAEAPLRSGQASYFPRTSQFSTYCLRMPYSEDLFDQATGLANWHGLGLLGIYKAFAGGQECAAPPRPGRGIDPVGFRAVVPQVRFDRSYREVDPDTGVEGQVDIVSGPILSDAFWYREHRKPPGDDGGNDVLAGWCHPSGFNVLAGNGSVRRVRDDGTIAANSVSPGWCPPDDGADFASYSIKVWRHLERGR